MRHLLASFPHLRHTILLFALFATACKKDKDDVDEDTYGADVDCDDNNADVHPDATEVCNEIDDNCVDGVDEGVTTDFFVDADLDTYGDPASTAPGCQPTEGLVNNSLDCNDANGAIHPNAAETCDSVDNNCNNQTDEGVTITLYADGDSVDAKNFAVKQ